MERQSEWYKIRKSVVSEGEYVRETYEVEFLENGSLQEGEIWFGQTYPDTSEEGVILTHEPWRTRYSIPYSFPAVISRIGGNEPQDIIYICDLANSDDIFSLAMREKESGILRIGFGNSAGRVRAGIKHFSQLVRIRPRGSEMFTELIGIAAEKTMQLYAPEGKNFFRNGLTYRLHNYTDACRALAKNIMDRRARPGNNEIATLAPYAYFEIMDVSESFASLGALKGLYPYAYITGDKEAFDFASRELHRMADPGSPWIEPAHGTQAFFHNHYEKGVFTDVDGHEEGPNLLSTWKYYDRVLRLAEMYDAGGDETFRDAFLRCMPFIMSLKTETGSQPVTYDLDSHVPATGKEGSAGGLGMWIVAALTAYRLSGQETYKQEAIRAAEILNKLDWFNMFSMRCAPTARGAGWTLRANILLFEETKDSRYLKHAKRVSGGLFGYYYLNTNPHTYFSTLGFCYACGRERWESARDICENIWLQLPLLRYTVDEKIIRLIQYFRQNYLWVLPVNGVPEGFPDAGYDSLGAEYVPFEFPTGTVGDTTGDWSFQSERRQVKELYGSAEIFIAQYMFEIFGKCAEDSDLLLNLTPVEKIRKEEREFLLQAGEGKNFAVAVFNNLKSAAYQVTAGDKLLGVYTAEQLKSGIRIPLAKKIERISLKGTDFVKAAGTVSKMPETVRLRLQEKLPNVYKCRIVGAKEASHFRVSLGNSVWTTEKRIFVLDNWEQRAANVQVCPVTSDGYMGEPAEFALNPADARIIDEPLQAERFHCAGADLVWDGALAMVYPQKKSRRAKISAVLDGKSFADAAIVELASLNGKRADITLLSEGKAVRRVKAFLPGKYMLRFPSSGRYTVTVSSDGGFSVGMCRAVCVNDRKECLSSRFNPSDWVKTEAGWEKRFQADLAFTPYLVIAAHRADAYRFIIRTERGERECLLATEERLPRTYCRNPERTFRFDLREYLGANDKDFVMRIEMKKAPDNQSFYAIGLTGVSRWPALHIYVQGDKKNEQ